MLPEPSVAPEKCLDSLEANLRTVLLHTGSALSDPGNFESTHISQTKARIAKHLPDALDEFHYALRQLELVLIRAKSALTRDLAASREAQGLSAFGTNSVSSPQPIDLDSDTVMIEAPRLHSDSISHVFGPPTPDPKVEQSKAAEEASKNSAAEEKIKMQEDDPFEHPKPIEFNPQADKLARDPGVKNEPIEDSHQHGSNSSGVGLNATATGDGTSIEAKAEEASTSNPSNTDDLDLLLGVELYAGDENTNDQASTNNNTNTNGIFDDNTTSEQTKDQGGSQSQLPEFDFELDDFNNLFGVDGDGMGDNNADGMGADGDVQGWDSSFFDENFFNLDGLS